MKKLVLKLDDLRVESFDTLETENERRGTVAANAPTNGKTCNCVTDDEPSCPYTCGIIPGTDPAFMNTMDCPVCG